MHEILRSQTTLSLEQHVHVWLSWDTKYSSTEELAYKQLAKGKQHKEETAKYFIATKSNMSLQYDFNCKKGKHK